MHAAIGQQHRRDTPANLLDWGLDPESHVQAARKLAHPFSEAPQTELNLPVAAEAYNCLGLRVRDARRKRLRLPTKLARAVAPLDSIISERRRCKLDQAPGVRPKLSAMLGVRSPLAGHYIAARAGA